MTDVKKIGFQFPVPELPKIIIYAYLMDVKYQLIVRNNSLSTFTATDVSWFPINNFTGTFEIEYGAVGFVQGSGNACYGLNRNYIYFSIRHV